MLHEDFDLSDVQRVPVLRISRCGKRLNDSLDADWAGHTPQSRCRQKGCRCGGLCGLGVVVGVRVEAGVAVVVLLRREWLRERRFWLAVAWRGSPSPRPSGAGLGGVCGKNYKELRDLVWVGGMMTIMLMALQCNS